MNKSKSFWEGVSDAFSFSTMLIIVLMLLTLMLAGCASVEQMPSRYRSDVVAELNRYRIDRGLTAVTTNPQLDALAAERARGAWPYRYKDLAKGHLGFQQAVNRSSAPGRWFGENLYSAGFSPSAREAVNAWHASHMHMLMINRKTSDDCSAAEAFDGKMSVVALICADRTSRDTL